MSNPSLRFSSSVPTRMSQCDVTNLAKRSSKSPSSIRILLCWDATPPPPPPPPPPLLLLLLLLLLLALLAASFCCWRRSVLGAASKPVDAEPRVVFDVRSYGASGDGQSDDTHAIQQALVAGAGRVVYFPAGTYRTTRMLTVQGPGTVVRGDSAALSCIKYGGSKGSPMAPVLYIPKEAAAATVHDLGIDQSADTGSYTEPVMFGHGVAKQSSPWWGCALIVSADDATIRSVSVRNSWDNGIAVGGYTTTCPSTPLIATPTRVSVLACRTLCNLYTGCMVRGEVLMLASSKSVSRDNIDVNV